MVAAAVAPSRQRSVIICSFIQYKCRHIGADTRRQLLIDWIFASETSSTHTTYISCDGNKKAHKASGQRADYYWLTDAI